MAVYFDHRVQAPYSGQNIELQWHSKAALLAVSTVTDAGIGMVDVYLEEGEHVPDAGLKKSKPATSISWHPSKRVLAAGWETGEISTWNEQEKEVFEATPVHKSPITVVHWTGGGTRLLTADDDGTLALWKSDSRGRLQQTPIATHNLSDPITQVVLKPNVVDENAIDLQSLARAAVSGDETALDMFNWKKGGKNLKMSNAALGPVEPITFFVGCKSGAVYYLNENGKLEQQFQAEGPVRKLLYYDDKNILVTVATNMMLTLHNVSPEVELREMLKVKLSGKADHADMIWAGKGILATCTGETVVRMWDLDKEENFILNLEGHKSYDRMEEINCLAYSVSKGVLSGGTSAGHVAMWKVVAAQGSRPEPEDRWKLQPPSTVESAISDITYGSSKSLIAVNTVEDIYILSEQVMSAHCTEHMAVVQTGPMQLSIDVYTTNTHTDLKCDIKIKGVYTTKEAIAIWDGKKLVIYDATGPVSNIRSAGTFSTNTSLVCLYEQNAYTLEPGKVQVRTFQGTVKQLLSFSEQEGDPICMEVCGDYLVVGTVHGVVKLFDLSRREAKAQAPPKDLTQAIPGFGHIVSVICNCNGSKVSVVTNRSTGHPDPKLYVWDVEMDSVQFFNLETGRGEQDEEFSNPEEENEQDVSDAEKGKNQAAKDIAGRYPITHFWDVTDPKLLTCEAKLLPQDQQRKEKDAPRIVSLTKATMDTVVEVMIVSLFVTPENGILIQDNFALSPQHNKLLGVAVPYYLFMKQMDAVKEDPHASMGQTGQGVNGQSMVSRRVMRDFIGLENADKTTKDAMMNFSFYLTIGNMDEAFKAIKLIKSESVWENMAKMCVKTRRLDVAAVCLGNMGHARGAKALREANKHPELDAKVAVLAMQLGLQDDAERLLKNCKRYDLLNDFYQSTGQWEKAKETAEMYDRVHLRTTYYNYAKHMESKGDVNAAIPNFEKSDTHRFEVPRMLFDEPQALENYIMKTKDKDTFRYLCQSFARHLESKGQRERALKYYTLCQDTLSIVRMKVDYDRALDEAAEICNETGDKASCYHLGRQYENNDDVEKAIHFFTRAGAYGNAIRLCRENGNEDKLMNLALLGRPEDMVEAARYYEYKHGHQDKAVMLYHKAGYFSKALDLAFNTKQFAALQMVSEDLDERTDPELVARCADFFTENGQFDRAVDLLAIVKKYWDALKICMEQHVPMTEDLVEKLTPSKEFGEKDPDERNKILEGIAEVCMQQREYHLATKKYTQAGNKMKAMKALLKSGDTEKIVFFAGVSRQKEIYVMAANYLQSLDWRKDPEIMKHIISFYTKGRALDSLSSFYDACAQVEIDEYQNYDKALGALSEAYKCMTKAKMKNMSLQEEKLADIKNRIGLIKKFIGVRRIYDEDAEEAIKQCQVLVEEPNIDGAVRVGDLYGLMIEHYARKQKWKAAYNSIEELRSRMPKLNMTYYVNIKTIEAVHEALGVPFKAPMGGGGIGGGINGFSPGGADDDIPGEEVEEDVPDELTFD